MTLILSDDATLADRLPERSIHRAVDTEMWFYVLRLPYRTLPIDGTFTPGKQLAMAQLGGIAARLEYPAHGKVML